MTPSRKAMFGRYLSEIDWSFLDSLESVEVKNQLFSDILSFGLFFILPEKRLLVYPNDHPWINEDLRRLIRLRQRAFFFGNDTLFKFIEIGLIGKGKLARLIIIRQK
jgi:hypothetical protein